jgi:hypothetical protein
MRGSPPCATAARSRAGSIPARISSGARAKWSGRTSAKVSCEGRFADRPFYSDPEVTGGLFQDPHGDSGLFPECSAIDAAVECYRISSRSGFDRLPYGHAGQHHPLACRRAAGCRRAIPFFWDVRPCSGVFPQFAVCDVAVGRDCSANRPGGYRLPHGYAGHNHFLDRDRSTGIQCNPVWRVALGAETN